MDAYRRMLSLRHPLAAMVPLLLLVFSLTIANSPVRAGEEVTIEKTVSQVNGEAPPASEVISVQAGDSIGYSISISSAADLGGTDLTVTDVFEADVLEFESASIEGCSVQADGEVTCAVTLDDAGGTELMLTFVVLEVGECRRMVNTVEVAGEEVLGASAEAEIEACPADEDGGDSDGAASPSPAPTENGAASPSVEPTAATQPDTAVGRTAARTAAPTSFGALLLAIALLVVVWNLRGKGSITASNHEGRDDTG